MPSVDTTPKHLRPFTSNGVAFAAFAGAEATAEECPFCGKELKFRVNTETSKCGCFVPGCFEGNSLTFLRKLLEVSETATTDEQREELRADRGLLFAGTAAEWGVGVSTLTSEWIIPAYDLGDNPIQLYRWSPGKDGKKVVKGSGGLEAGLFRAKDFNAGAGTVWVTEGVWDAMALREALGAAKETAGGLRPTGERSASLLADAEVVAMPGAGVFLEKWLPLFAGKRVVLAHDNDDAGQAGARKAAEKLAAHPEAPTSIERITWPEGSADGFDVRDYLANATTPAERAAATGNLLGLVEPIPDDWVAGRGDGAKHGSPHLAILPCRSWPELVNSWRKAMRWTDDLEHMLAVCLASIISTETQGNSQVWVMVMAAPSTGKTTICEALAVAREWVHCKSVLTQLFSGYKIDKEGSEDFGDIPLIKGKTLIVKDGDTLLEHPERGVILSQYRDAFDGAARMKYRNGLSFQHEGLKFTKILCGTAKMRELDAAEAGARFINVCFAEHVSEQHEREVNRHVVHRAFRNVRVIANGRAETFADGDMTEAKRMTGGYVDYLRRNAAELIGRVDVDEDVADVISSLGEFAAFMRARQPKKQDEVTEREMSHRLVEQFARLACCLAAVLGKRSVDRDVMARVRRAALDTARGRTLELAEFVAETGERGTSIAGLAVHMGESEDKTKARLTFLKRIGVVERHEPKKDGDVFPRATWRLTERLTRLWNEVFQE